MKLLLVNPYFNSHIITPPLALGYLSSYIKKNYPAAEVKVIDCLRENIPAQALAELVAREKADLVGITTYSLFYTAVRDASRRIKQASPATLIAIGGPHVSALPEFCLEDTAADFAIFGEGEESFKELVEAIDKQASFSSIKGLCFRDKNRVVKNSPRPLIGNISEIPWPDWFSLDPRKYPAAPHGGVYKRFPVAPLTTTRGCPFDCVFCGSSITWGKLIRYRTKEDVLGEIEYLVKDFGVREFHFEDDNFTLSKEHALGICEEIIKRKLDIVWSCPNGIRIDTLDDELLKAMKSAGCYLVAFGIESGSQEILDKMHKRLNKDSVYAVVKKVRDIGIETWGAFIIGLPGESKKTALETINFAKRLPLDRATFCNFMPIPGTPLFGLWLKQQKIEDISQIDWDELNFYGKCVYNTDELSAEALTKIQRKAMLSFYLRPRIALNMASKIRLNQLGFMKKRLQEYILK